MDILDQLDPYIDAIIKFNPEIKVLASEKNSHIIGFNEAGQPIIDLEFMGVSGASLVFNVFHYHNKLQG